MTDDLAWKKGYFEFLENRPFTSAIRLSQHCFRDNYVHVGRYYDEYRNQLPGPVEPVGSWGLKTFRGIAKQISKALGIPLPPD